MLMSIILGKRERSSFLVLVILVIEDGKDNSPQTVSIIKGPHRSGSSFYLPKGSFDKVGSNLGGPIFKIDNLRFVLIVF